MFFYLLLLVLSTSFWACTSNIQHIESPKAPVEKQKTFNVPFEKVWVATQRALAETETFKILDKTSGMMVTEFRAVDAKELSLWQIYWGSKTYKFSYTVNLFPNDTNTLISVSVKLHADQYAFLAREESNEDVEAYLRKKLFDKISLNLGLVKPGSNNEIPPSENLGPAREQTMQQSMKAQPPKMTISKVQQRLHDLGYQPGPVDGIAGKRTIDALKKFQENNNLPVTGNLDDETINKLEE